MRSSFFSGIAGDTLTSSVSSVLILSGLVGTDNGAFSIVTAFVSSVFAGSAFVSSVFAGSAFASSVFAGSAPVEPVAAAYCGAATGWELSMREVLPSGDYLPSYPASRCLLISLATRTKTVLTCYSSKRSESWTRALKSASLKSLLVLATSTAA